jgi:dGTP triphosphohydrolase
MDDNKNTLTIKKMTNVKNIQLSKLKVKFNINTLDMIIAFIFKDSVLRTRKTLMNIYKLVTNLDESLYDNPDMKVRLWIIETVLYAKLYRGLDSREAMIDTVSDEATTSTPQEVLTSILNTTKISHDESKYLIKKLDDALEFGYVVTVKDVIHELIDKIDDADFKTYKSIQDDLYDIAISMVNIKRNTSSLSSDQTFSLQEDVFDHVVDEAMQKLLDRNRIFRTGND